MTTLDKQILDLLLPVLESARKINPLINSACLIVDFKPDERGVYCNFNGSDNFSHDSCYGIESSLAKVKAYDPKAEKLAAIEKLKAELAALEQSTLEAK